MTNNIIKIVVNYSIKMLQEYRILECHLKYLLQIAVGACSAMRSKP